MKSVFVELFLTKRLKNGFPQKSIMQTKPKENMSYLSQMYRENQNNFPIYHKRIDTPKQAWLCTKKILHYKYLFLKEKGILHFQPSYRKYKVVFCFAGMVLSRNGMESGMSMEWNKAGMVIPILTFGFTKESIQ